jgi:hypothetical protein
VRRALWIVLAIALALIFLNDASRWVNAQSRLNETTAEIAQWAALNVHDQTRDRGAQLVAAEAARRGVQVYQYDQDPTTVRVWSSVDVPGTWVVGPYVAVTTGGIPADKAFGVPFVVRSYQQAQFQ